MSDEVALRVVVLASVAEAMRVSLGVEGRSARVRPDPDDPHDVLIEWVGGVLRLEVS